jgi:type I restriction enzyme, S subunit
MVREGYKETELGEIPEEWEIYTLGNDVFFRLETGGTPSTENPRYWGGNIPWLKSGEVNNKKIYKSELFITQSGYNSSNAKFLPIFTILVALAGQGKTRGTIAITNIELTTNQSVAGIICNVNKVFPFFVYHFLNSKYEELRTSSLGAGRAGLSLKVLREFNHIIPPLPEQHRIATVLSTLDECIEKTEVLIAKLRLVKVGLMQDLLTRGIDNEGRIRDESTHEFKDTEIGRVPMEWDVVPLQSIASVKTGPFGAQLHESDYVDEGTPIITVEHLSDFGIIHQQLPRVSDYDKRRLSQYLLIKGDIVFSRVGSIDRNSLIQEIESGWLFSGRLLRVRPINNTIFTQYLSYYFLFDKFKNFMRNVAVGGIMASIILKY